MYKFLEKQSYLVILLVLGIFLFLFGFFDVTDISKLQVCARGSAVWPSAVLGTILCIVSVLLYTQDNLALGWFKTTKVKNVGDGLCAKFQGAEINIIFGRIEEVSKQQGRCMVVLPANEYFDDECINDKKSTLGAYVNSNFPNQAEQLNRLITNELTAVKARKVEKEVGVEQDSYGIGAGVFLNEPLGSKQPILFLAVTIKRAGEGLRAEMSYIFQAVNKIQQEAADHRIDSVCVPIMGSGHGGLRKEVALFGLLLAICDGVTKPFGHHIRQYNVVVFRYHGNERPSISRKASKRLLKAALGMFL